MSKTSVPTALRGLSATRTHGGARYRWLASDIRSVAAIAACGIMGCTTKPAVVSVGAEGADLSAYHTFSMMTVPTRTTPPIAAGSSNASGTTSTVTAGGDVGSTANNQMDPMLASSPVGRAIRTDIVQSFTGRGYGEWSAPDFLVAYYAGLGDVINVQAYPYGYTGMSKVGRVDIRDYPAGTVIVDVVDAKTQQLVWRGQGVAKIPNDPDLYARELAVTVHDVVAQFPRAPQPKS